MKLFHVCAFLALSLAVIGSVSGLELPGNNSIPLKIENPLFRDPYSSGALNGAGNQALLDITIETKCVSNLVVYVHLPDAYDATEATATLVGPSFGPKLVRGYSDHAYNNAQTTCVIQWNNVTKVLTFSNFTAGGATAPVDPSLFSDNSPYWINLNFNIPDIAWNSSEVPLQLVPIPHNPPANQLKITLTQLKHFNATATNDTCTDPGPHGDPVFAGFQGQNFQFHGLPDEHFNLVSSPNVSVNAHFVYLASGKCDYTDTECWTHPGTYMDVLGFTIADSHIKIVAGTHEAGLRVWADDIELTRGERVTDFNCSGFIHYHRSGRVEIQTDIMGFQIINSDMFMNMKVSLNNPTLLRVGQARHTITDKTVCKANSETSHHQLVESIVAAKYPVTTPLHGLIGQTWRNVKVCGNDWMGTTEDYLVSDLFANDNHYNYFTW